MQEVRGKSKENPTNGDRILILFICSMFFSSSSSFLPLSLYLFLALFLSLSLDGIRERDLNCLPSDTANTQLSKYAVLLVIQSAIEHKSKTIR